MSAIAAHGSSPTPPTGTNFDPLPYRAFLAAAMKYAAFGWRILPGPVCDGIANWHPVSTRPLGVNETTVPRESATADQRIVETWWNRYPQGILAPVGESFDVLRVSTPLASQAAAILETRHLGPVALAPSGGYFFVEQGAVLAPELGKIRGIELMPPNSVVALPPTRVRGGVVSWWISPLRSNGRLGNMNVIQDALRDSMPRRAVQ